jgi:hypothetical protein
MSSSTEMWAGAPAFTRGVKADVGVPVGRERALTFRVCRRFHSHRLFLLLDVLLEHGERRPADRPGEVGTRPEMSAPEVFAGVCAVFLTKYPGRSPFSKLTSLDRATLGG